MRRKTTEGNFHNLEVGLQDANERPKIAVVPVPRDFKLASDYIDALFNAGGEPVLLERGPRGFEQLKSAQGLLVPGVGVTGPNVPEEFWTNELSPLDQRDWSLYPEQLEWCKWVRDIVLWALENKLPILGAGFGAQLLVVCAGGQLERYVEGHANDDPQVPSGIERRIEIVPESWLADAWNELLPGENEGDFDEEDLSSVRIICAHHQAFAEPLAANILVVARTEDGQPHAVTILDDEGVPCAYGTVWETQHRNDPEGFGERLFHLFVRRLAKR